MNESIMLGEIDTTKCPQCHETYGELDSWFNEKTMKLDTSMRFICGKCSAAKFIDMNEVGR